MGYTGVQKTRMEGFLMDIKTQIADIGVCLTSR